MNFFFADQRKQGVDWEGVVALLEDCRPVAGRWKRLLSGDDGDNTIFGDLLNADDLEKN